MTDLVKTFSFPSDSESFVFTSDSGDSTGAWLSSDGDPANGSLSLTTTGRKKPDTAHWDLTGITWEDLGVPAGAIITAISAASCNHKCSVWVAGDTASLESIALIDGAITIELAGLVAYTGTTAWANKTGAGATGLSLASSNALSIVVDTATLTANAATTDITLLQDEITFTITYSAGSTTTPITLTPTAVGSSALTSVASHFRTLSNTGAGSVSVSKLISKALAYASAGASVLSKVATFYRALSYTAVGTVAFSKGLVSSAVANMTAVGSSVSSTVTSHISLTSYSGVGSSTITKLIGKGLSYTSSGVETLTKVSTYLRTYSFSGVGASSLIRGLFSSVQANMTATGAAISSYLAVIGVTSLITAIGSSSVSKFISKGLSYVSAGTANVIKRAKKTLSSSATGTSVGTQQLVAAILKGLSYTATGISNLITQFIAAPPPAVRAVIKRITAALGIGL